MRVIPIWYFWHHSCPVTLGNGFFNREGPLVRAVMGHINVEQEAPEEGEGSVGCWWGCHTLLLLLAGHRFLWVKTTSSFSFHLRHLEQCQIQSRHWQGVCWIDECLPFVPVNSTESRILCTSSACREWLTWGGGTQRVILQYRNEQNLTGVRTACVTVWKAFLTSLAWLE